MISEGQGQYSTTCQCYVVTKYVMLHINQGALTPYTIPPPHPHPLTARHWITREFILVVKEDKQWEVKQIGLIDDIPTHFLSAQI